MGLIFEVEEVIGINVNDSPNEVRTNMSTIETHAVVVANRD